MELLTGVSAVAIRGSALLIAGPPGSGKSSLALALIDRGAALISDDGVQLLPGPRAGMLCAAPVAATRGLLEIRNLGLVTLPVEEHTPVALMVRLIATAPRFIDTAGQYEMAGAILPLVELFAETPVLALRAEWALRQYGLAPHLDRPPHEAVPSPA